MIELSVGTKANINPEGLIMFFAKIDDGHDHGASEEMMNYLSTHPMPEKRVEYLSEKLEALPFNEYQEPIAEFDWFKERMNKVIGYIDVLEDDLIDDEAVNQDDTSSSEE